MEVLEDTLKNQFKLMREDIDRHLDGNEARPGILRKLDKLDEIPELLEKILKSNSKNNNSGCDL